MLKKTNNNTAEDHYLNQSKTFFFDDKTLLDDSEINSNDLSTSELNNIYNDFYFVGEEILNTTKQNNNTHNNISHLNISRMNIRDTKRKEEADEIYVEEVAVLIIYLYNQSLNYNAQDKRLEIFAWGLSIDHKNRIIENGFNALCSFYKSQAESEENLTNGKFKICEKVTTSEKLYKFLCCIGQSTNAQEKRSFAKLVGDIHKKMKINYKIFKALKESQDRKRFAQLCQAINPSAIIAEQTIEAVWSLCAKYKERQCYKPMFELQNDKDFQSLSSKLLGEVTMVNSNASKIKNNYISVNNISNITC